MLLNCGVGEDSWESLGLQGDPTSPSWRRSVLGVHWKDWCWSWNSNTLATWCEEPTHWERPWCWERLKAGGEGDDRGWDGWLASPTQWTWVWVDSGSWWWTGRPGVLRYLWSHRVKHDWATELNWTGFSIFTKLHNITLIWEYFHHAEKETSYLLAVTPQFRGNQHTDPLPVESQALAVTSPWVGKPRMMNVEKCWQDTCYVCCIRLHPLSYEAVYVALTSFGNPLSIPQRDHKLRVSLSELTFPLPIFPFLVRSTNICFVIQDRAFLVT